MTPHKFRRHFVHYHWLMIMYKNDDIIQIYKVISVINLIKWRKS
jgi:hypothetical protein